MTALLRFDVAAEMVVTADLTAPEPVFTSEPMTQRDRELAAGRARTRRVYEARRLPGFQGFSTRAEADVVINGEHVALTPRLFRP